jgi:hypothetical protein
MTTENHRNISAIDHGTNINKYIHKHTHIYIHIHIHITILHIILYIIIHSRHIFVDSGLSAVRNSEDVYLCPTDLGKPYPSREPQCWSLQDARGLIQGFGIQKSRKRTRSNKQKAVT